jgi:hypothetical protein
MLAKNSGVSEYKATALIRECIRKYVRRLTSSQVRRLVHYTGTYDTDILLRHFVNANLTRLDMYDAIALSQSANNRYFADDILYEYASLNVAKLSTQDLMQLARQTYSSNSADRIIGLKR